MKKSSSKKSAVPKKKSAAAEKSKAAPKKIAVKKSAPKKQAAVTRPKKTATRKAKPDTNPYPMFAVAQDPRWIFCYWDPQLTTNDGENFFLRLSLAGSDKVEAETSVPSGSNSWYLQVAKSGALYDIELGRYRGAKWQRLSFAPQIPTPRDQAENPEPAVFATSAPDDEFRQIIAIVQAAASSGEKVSATISRLQREGRLPSTGATPAQRAVLDRLLEASTSWFGSSALSSGHGIPNSWSGSITGISSWSSAGLARRPTSSWSGAPRGFFMNVNAELIFYGGTHPQARVTIDGKPVQLQPDGTFRFHFVYPDAGYEIPIVAVSPDGLETRRAVLRFERSTSCEGQVDATPQPPLGEPMGRKS